LKQGNIVKKVFLCVLVLCLALSCGGCAFFKLMAAVASPSYYELKIDAEFDLKDRAEGKILIVVGAAGGSMAGPVEKQQLSSMLHALVVGRLKLDEEDVMSHRAIADLLYVKGSVSRLAPKELGRELGAETVLYVFITKYGLYEVPEQGYHYGSMAIRGVLIDSESGDVLWPAKKTGRYVEAMVEVETRGRDVAASRLGTTVSHGIVRNLYDCPKYKYTTRDEVENHGQFE
jgi:hypothetical protein